MSAEWETTDEAFHAGLSKLPTALGEWQRLRKKLASAHRRFARPPYKSLRQVGSYEFGGDERTLRKFVFPHQKPQSIRLFGGKRLD